MSENVERGIADDVTETPAAAGAEGQEGIADEEKNDGGIADLPKETPPGESEKEPEAPKGEPAAEAQPAAAPAEPGQEASFEEYQDITFED